MKSTTEEFKAYQEVVDGVIAAESSADLKELLDKVKQRTWLDKAREIFLWGLLQGALMQYKKDVAVMELQTIFRNN